MDEKWVNLTVDLERIVIKSMNYIILMVKLMSTQFSCNTDIEPI